MFPKQPPEGFCSTEIFFMQLCSQISSRIDYKCPIDLSEGLFLSQLASNVPDMDNFDIQAVSIFSNQ